MRRIVLFSSIASLNFAGPAHATIINLLGPELEGLTIFSDTAELTGANSITFGSILSGGVSTAGGNAIIYGSLTSTGAANGGDTSLITGDMISGDVLTVGANGKVNGQVKSSGAATIGANAVVGGSITSGGVATTGDSSKVTGNVRAGGAASIGANAVVGGFVGAVGVISLGANSTVTSVSQLGSSPLSPTNLTQSIADTVISASAEVSDAQTRLFALGGGTGLAATITTDETLNAGIYSAASLSTTAGTTLYLDAQGKKNQSWIFNIADILALGGTTKVVVINGDGANVIGTFLSSLYTSVGANAYVTRGGTNCGGIYSAHSYVTTGDSAHVGGGGCTNNNITAVPEPSTWGLMLVGFALVGSAVRRRMSNAVHA